MRVPVPASARRSPLNGKRAITRRSPPVRSVVLAAACVALGAWSAPAAEAQVGSPSVGAGVVLESYQFQSKESVGMESVTLLSMPFLAGIRLRPGTHLQVSGAWASGQIERADGTSADIRGLTDTRIQLETVLGTDRLRVAGILELPTGHSRYTGDEADAAGTIAADLLPFQITNWGGGGAFGIHTSTAYQVGGFGLGASATYLVGREFEVFSGEDASFRPGNQFAVGVAADRTVRLAGKAAIHLQMVNYGSDEFAGSSLYRSGSRYRALGSYAFPGPRYSSAMVYGSITHRTRGAFLQLAEETSSQNLLSVGAVLRMPLRWGALVPAADFRLLRSADGLGQGYVATAGAGAEREMAGITLVPSLRARLGRVVPSEGVRSGLWGLELGLTARLGGAP